MKRTLWLFLLPLFSACVVEEKNPRHPNSNEDLRKIFQTRNTETPQAAPVAVDNAPKETLQGPKPNPETAAPTPKQFKPGERIIVRPDGRYSKFFSIRSGRGEQFRNLMIKYCSFAEAAIELIPRGDVESIKDPKGPSNAAPAAMDISDWLVVTGTEEEIVRAEEFLNLYYASVPQIEIEAKIAEVTADNVKDIGAITDVFNSVKGKIVEDVDPTLPGTQNPPPNFNNLFNQINTSLPNTSTTTTTNIVLRAILGTTELKSVLQLLVSQRNVDIVSSPRIAVRNGGKAEIINGEEIPYVNITNYAPGQSTFSGSVQYKQTGVKLYIVPYLAGTDTILLNVEAEISLPSGVSNVGGVSNPTIVTRNAKTDVHIRDGSTFVIGGLISSSDTEFVKKVPLLGDIPIVGYLFRSTFTQKVYTEVIFFITPRVLHREAAGNELILP